MDDLDLALLDAWHRVSARVRADRVEALRRAARRGRPTLSRPVRPWCLAIRAADTRLRERAWVPKDLPELRIDHQVMLSSAAIQNLCKPVVIDWPGIDLMTAAAMVGRPHQTLRKWVQRGVLRCKWHNGQSVGKRGKPVPYVWSPRPLDPSAGNGKPPHPAWGTLWVYLWQRIPPNLEFTVERINQGGWRERNCLPQWYFKCPGLAPGAIAAEVDAPDPLPTCGRLVRHLFIPMPVWTLADALDCDDPLDITFAFPTSLTSPAATAVTTNEPDPRERFRPACNRCHRLITDSMNRPKAWNHLVSQLSGGLLYGHEVRRPADLPASSCGRPIPAWRPWHAIIKQNEPEIRRLLAAGTPPREIEQQFAIGPRALRTLVERIKRENGKADAPARKPKRTAA